MAFILVDLGNPDRELMTNAWRWRPTLDIIRSLNIIDVGRLNMLEFNGSDATISECECKEIAERLEADYISRMKKNERVSPDLSIISEPAKGWDDAYGADRPWLEEFTAFCKTCGGFKVM